MAVITGAKTEFIAARKATTPSERRRRPIPHACSRALTPWLAAMPTSAQGPHCTLELASPYVRRHTLRESKQQFAAE
eukprot:scaffold11155_cov141-Isochrysis_galbana.AAC.6